MEQQLQAGVDPACRAIWRSPLRMMPSGDYAIGCARELSGGRELRALQAPAAA
jgi:hypothetical protein